MLNIDFTKEYGTIKKLNGINLGPPLKNSARVNQSPRFKDLHAPYARMHDAPATNGGYKLVDIPMIFANFRANANDPDNYYFRQTDDYFLNTVAQGTKIYFRFGVSIEFGVNKYFTYPPDDFEKWIDICINIIRHYNEGWANGYCMNIEYWEIWNEPDAYPMMWAGDFEQYLELYLKASKRIKTRFPHIKVGGFAAGAEDISKYGNRAKYQFLEFCRKHDAPLDFFSWHIYSASVEEMLEQPFFIKKMLDEYGYSETELHLNEWHYAPPERWAQSTDNFGSIGGMNGIESAAFAVSTLIGWQDGPLTLGCYYVFGPGIYGLYNGNNNRLFKTYFSLAAFGEMTECTRRVRSESDDPAIKVLAGLTRNDKKMLLISSFESDLTTVTLKLNTDAEFLFTTVDLANDYTESETATKGTQLVFSKKDRSVVWLLKEK